MAEQERQSVFQPTTISPARSANRLVVTVRRLVETRPVGDLQLDTV